MAATGRHFLLGIAFAISPDDNFGCLDAVLSIVIPWFDPLVSGLKRSESGEAICHPFDCHPG